MDEGARPPTTFVQGRVTPAKEALSMKRRDMPKGAAVVAESMAGAVHRRDHTHRNDTCHPHLVEVVGLGDQAMAVCHDCGLDSGLVGSREAERLASEHLDQTA